MSVVSTDRWTCPHPTCRKTYTFPGHWDPKRIARLIRAAQQECARNHHKRAR